MTEQPPPGDSRDEAAAWLASRDKSAADNIARAAQARAMIEWAQANPDIADKYIDPGELVVGGHDNTAIVDQITNMLHLAEQLDMSVTYIVTAALGHYLTEAVHDVHDENGTLCADREERFRQELIAAIEVLKVG